MNVLPKGVRHIPAALSADEQRVLVNDDRLIVQAAPLFVPVMTKSLPSSSPVSTSLVPPAPSIAPANVPVFWKVNVSTPSPPFRFSTFDQPVVLPVSAEQLVALDVVESISAPTVMRALKKTNCNRIDAPVG